VRVQVLGSVEDVGHRHGGRIKNTTSSSVVFVCDAVLMFKDCSKLTWFSHDLKRSRLWNFAITGAWLL
jgi:hypothetical protein